MMNYIFSKAIWVLALIGMSSCTSSSNFKTPIKKPIYDSTFWHEWDTRNGLQDTVFVIRTPVFNQEYNTIIVAAIRKNGHWLGKKWLEYSNSIRANSSLTYLPQGDYFDQNIEDFISDITKESDVQILGSYIDIYCRIDKKEYKVQYFQPGGQDINSAINYCDGRVFNFFSIVNNS